VYPVADTHLPQIVRNESEDSDAGLDEQYRLQDGATQSQGTVSSFPASKDGNLPNSRHQDLSTSTTTITIPITASQTTTTTTTNDKKTSPAVDPIKDDGFCGYHCWSFYLTDPAFKNMKALFLGNSLVTQAIHELYPYYGSSGSGSSTTHSGGNGYEGRETVVTKFAQLLESSGSKYPYTPLLRYLDLK